MRQGGRKAKPLRVVRGTITVTNVELNMGAPFQNCTLPFEEFQRVEIAINPFADDLKDLKHNITNLCSSVLCAMTALQHISLNLCAYSRSANSVCRAFEGGNARIDTTGEWANDVSFVEKVRQGSKGRSFRPPRGIKSSARLGFPEVQRDKITYTFGRPTSYGIRFTSYFRL